MHQCIGCATNFKRKDHYDRHFHPNSKCYFISKRNEAISDLTRSELLVQHTIDEYKIKIETIKEKKKKKYTKKINKLKNENKKTIDTLKDTYESKLKEAEEKINYYKNLYSETCSELRSSQSQCDKYAGELKGIKENKSVVINHNNNSTNVVNVQYKIQKYEMHDPKTMNTEQMKELAEYICKHGLIEGHLEYVKKYYCNKNPPNVYIRDLDRQKLERYNGKTWIPEVGNNLHVDTLYSYKIAAARALRHLSNVLTNKINTMIVRTNEDREMYQVAIQERNIVDSDHDIITQASIDVYEKYFEVINAKSKKRISRTYTVFKDSQPKNMKNIFSITNTKPSTSAEVKQDKPLVIEESDD